MVHNLHILLQSFSKKKILVVGDVMLDQYTYGTVRRISPEAPVPVVEKTSEKFILGGAANVANNAASLGAKVTLIGVVGNDQRKNTMVALLKEKHIQPSLVTSNSRPTILKNRIMVSEFQQLLRFDDEVTTNLTAQEEKQVLSFIAKELPKADFVILSDYAKGFFSKSLSQQILKLAKKSKKIVLADIKPKNKEFFIGVDLIAPNLKEAQEMSGEKDSVLVGKTLTKYFQTNILLTLGAE